MTILTRWDPAREHSPLQDRMNRLFRESYSPGGPEEALTTTGFAPPVDIYEDEHTITLKLEVPGIDEKDIDVRIENNTLTVHGEAQDREGRERGELPSRRAAIWKLYPLLYPAQLRGSRASERRLCQGRAEHQARQEG
jgi:HSP20 family molecular chaperone IbpA